MLAIENLKTRYGKNLALKDVSLCVNEGEIVAIIGSNGAGKSTLLRTISGLVRAYDGQIRFYDEDFTEADSCRIVEAGIIHVPEGRMVIAKMTVYENLLVGAHAINKRDDIKRDLDMVLSEFPILKERLKQRAGTLSGGEQQMLVIGRALMATPKLLMLDEPSLGLAPILVEKVFQIIGDLHKRGITILLVEQNARKALSIANRGYVLEVGNVVLFDTAERLLINDQVKRSYLGA